MDEEHLRQKQNRFAGMVARLLLKAQEMGFEVTLGEAYRTPEQAFLKGSGIRNSLHSLRLAIDLNLFLNGTWLIGSEDHRPLGEWWESIGGVWGGNFSRPEGSHYEFSRDESSQYGRMYAPPARSTCSSA